MVHDAEAQAEDDKRKKELADVRNQADTLVYTTEKSLKEHGDKLEAAVKENIEKEMENLKQKLTSENVGDIKEGIDKLSAAAQKLAEVLYAQNNQSGDASQAGSAYAQEEPSKKDENVVDADFEEVKDDKK